MVDQHRRKKLAFHLRQLVTGRISNDEFEERMAEDVIYGSLPCQYYRSKECIADDAAIQPIVELSWCLYNDSYNHKLTGKHQLSREGLKEIARLILFLHSDLEYRWRYVDMTNPLLRLSWAEILLSIGTLGLYYWAVLEQRKTAFEAMRKEGDYAFWPFKTKAEYEVQLTRRPFLKG